MEPVDSPAKSVLLIAFHYPPCAASSGLQRTLAFSQALPRYGWRPLLVTATRNAYERISEGQMDEVPVSMPLARGLALDAARELAIFGRYPGFLAVPDRWASWRLFGLRAARRLVRQFRPRAIWSTFPTPTAHAIAARLAKDTGLPWIADMRDPMVEYDAETDTHFPTNPRLREARLEIERQVVGGASAITCCTVGALEILRARYGDELPDASRVISNGYNESAFAHLADSSPARAASGPVRLVHSGTMYAGSDRGPEGLFAALRTLDRDGSLSGRLSITLRATGHDREIAAQIREFGVEHLVTLAPALDYRDALREMTEADGLLLLQGRTSNTAIPAKVYEYFRARRPILALVHAEGDTARLLADKSAAVQAPLDDPAAIAEVLTGFVDGARRGRLPVIDAEAMSAYDRHAQSGDLASLLDEVSAAERTRGLETGRVSES